MFVNTAVAEFEIPKNPVPGVEILREHAESLPEGPMRESDLLFPADTGGLRTTTALDKPFRVVAQAVGLKKKVTPKEAKPPSARVV